MSLIGIDVGSSSVKITAYDVSWKTLGAFRQDLTAQHPRPGSWEQDPEEVWAVVSSGMQNVVALETLRHDPPLAIAISASGRENFPVDSAGRPLGPCVMAADLRGAEFEQPPEGAELPEAWTLSCGHSRQRMDPGMRFLWWRENHPRVMALAAHFLGWHEFLALRMTGRPIVDPSLAGRWLAYDLEREGWLPERALLFGVDPAFLPQIQPWGSVIDVLKPEIAEAWGLAPDVCLAVGALDLTCAAIGAGALASGTACLVSGSFENLLIPCEILPSPRMLMSGLSCTPYPAPSGLSLLALSPTGTAVLNWARNLLGVSIDSLDERLKGSGGGPSPVRAVPYLSGAMLHWEEGRKAKGAMFGLTLATSSIDIIKAFMESITCDHVMTLSLLASMGESVVRLKAAGGGTRSEWWTQLKADVLGVPIEVVDEAEPGTLGAAMLAGLAIGCYRSLPDGYEQLSTGSGRLFTPNAGRGALYRVRVEEYREIVASLLENVHQEDERS